MRLTLRKNVHMVIDEDGVLSIEASLVLPIYVLILITLCYIINYIVFNTQNVYMITKDLVQNDKSYYIDNNILPSKRIINYDKNYYEDEDKINYEYSYNYKMPLTFIGEIEVDKIITLKSFNEGKSMLSYGLVSEYIKSDYDVWLLSNINRAKDINMLLDGYNSFDGTSIDKIYNEYLVSIVSLDFRKESYENDYAIVNKLKDDIKKLNEFENGYVNKKYISKEDYKRKMLNVVIPTKNFGKNVEMQLLMAKNYCNENNIQFKVTVIE